MKYSEFANVLTPIRMSRYLLACNGNSRKAMTLYRKNLKLSQELFTVISCFEIALRNVIDKHYSYTLGSNWLQKSASPSGIFSKHNCRVTQVTINDSINKLNVSYTHSKLVAELGFGFWRYMFAHQQFGAAGKSLLRIMPGKPKSSIAIQYNHTYIFNQLALINNLRNRIAHHEPICFISGKHIKDTSYALQHYNLILQLFQWMNIEESGLLYGLDHIVGVCSEIEQL